MIDFTDLLPTFAELGHAELPADLTIDGRSFAPLLSGTADDSPRDWIMAMGHGAATLVEQGIRGASDYVDRVIRDKQFKVWIGTNRQIVALYDLASDPWEKRNLLDSNRSDVVAALKKFRAIQQSMPPQDGRPRYHKRQPLRWDRKPAASR